MSDATSADPVRADPAGPIVFAYDGTDLAGSAIAHAAGLLDTTRDALVVCVWQPAEVGFTPVEPRHFDADRADEVSKAAQATAAHGATLAQTAGFRAQGVAIEFSPTWKGILEAADQHDADVIVLGSALRQGVLSHLLGSVAAAVVAHSSRSVLVVHPH